MTASSELLDVVEPAVAPGSQHWHHTPALPHPAVTPTARPALRTAVRSYSAEDVERASVRIAAKLRGRGVQSGDRVVLKAQNSADYVMVLLALAHLDVSIVLLDNGQTVAECQRAISRANGRWLLADRHLAAGPETTVVTIDELNAEEPPEDCLHEVLSFAAWFARYDAMITWSSGSAGTPKGVVRSGPALRAVIDRTRERMGYLSEDVLLPLVPFSHFYGLSTVLLWWTVRCSLVVSPNGRLDQALRLGVDAGVTVLDATPASYRTIHNLMERRPELLAELVTVRMWCVGGAPLAVSLAEGFQRLVGLPLLDGYGGSEVGNVAMAASTGPGSCGLPLDGVDVQIVDEHGARVADGKVGEIWVRSAGLMEGYLAEDGTVTARTDAGTYHTQDLGRWGADGALIVLGRKHAVHRLGHTLYPEVIERKAEACGRPVKIVALEDERRGSTLVFVIEDPAGGHPQDWRRVVNALLPSYERPNRMLVLPRFPLNRNGKPDLLELRRLAGQAQPAFVGRPAELLAAIAPDAALPDGLPELPFDERRQALRRVTDFLRNEPQRVIEILTEISNHKSVELEIEAALHTLDGADEEVRRYRPDLVPQLTVFMSSNVLLYSYVLYLLVPSLFTERIAFRPSGQVGRQTRLLHELLAPVHQLPIELTALSQKKFVQGPVAQASVVVFTGTYANAEEVRAQLHHDQLFLFFGQGINPFIVTPQADLDLAVNDAIRIRLLNSGQDCFAPDIYFVHQPDSDRFVELLRSRLAEQRYGSNDDPTADYGPLSYDSAFRTATDYLTRCRDNIVHGGEIDFKSRHVQPTIVAREAGADLEIAELFSPIFNVVAYHDVEQLAVLLSSSYFNERAMGAMVYGEHAGLVEQLSQRHTVAVNETLLEADTGNSPFGGLGMMANYTSHRNKRIAEPILISKAVADHYRISA
jgi:long-chain acyl-CoA synthetase